MYYIVFQKIRQLRVAVYMSMSITEVKDFLKKNDNFISDTEVVKYSIEGDQFYCPLSME